MKIRFFFLVTIPAILLLFSFSSSFGQERLMLDSGEVYIMDAPETHEVCQFTPTGKNANYFLGANHFAKTGVQTEQTADIQTDYVSACNGQPFPEEAKTAFEYAAQIWGQHLESDVPIRIEASWAALGGNTLGSAGPAFVVSVPPPAGQSQTWYTVAQASAITGDDIATQYGEEYDIYINFSCNFSNWYFETDTNTPNGEIDFVTVALHELGHGLGFIGSVQADAGNQTAQWGFGGQGFPIIYDRFTEDGNSNSIIDTSVYGNPSAALYGAVTGQQSGVFFTGDDARSVNGGGVVRLYAPSQWQGGSSYSHLDQVTFSNTENALMRPSIDAAFAVHSPGPVFCGMFKDMGWPIGQGCRDLLGVESEIVVEDSDGPLDEGSEELAFGVTNVGSAEDLSIIIRNDELAIEQLNGNLVVEGSNFSITGVSNTSFSLPPGEAKVFNVQYRPRNVNEHEGEIRISHNSLRRNSPIIVALSGEALEENRQVALEQSYPNPIIPNQSTLHIPFAIPEDTNVRIELYNAAGQHISTLLNETRTSGRYSEPFNVQGLASGVYLYRIIVDGADETGKLMIVN